MPEAKTMENYTTLMGALASTIPIIQVRPRWVDALASKDAILGVQVFQHTNCTLQIQTALVPEGPWTTIASFTGSTVTTKYFTSREDGTNKFDRYLRWQLDRNAANWKTGFKLEVNVL